jgi:hypothetical protein
MAKHLFRRIIKAGKYDGQRIGEGSVKVKNQSFYHEYKSFMKQLF